MSDRAGRADSVGVEGIARDVTERHALQEALAHQALHDSLTGLPNRALFFTGSVRRSPGPSGCRSTVAVMLLDVDNFKLVNDSSATHVGDELLVAIARRLSGARCERRTVARLGGDEFAFVLEESRPGRSSSWLPSRERILSAFAEPFTVGDLT